jgi:hypothetical protein
MALSLFGTSKLRLPDPLEALRADLLGIEDYTPFAPPESVARALSSGAVSGIGAPLSRASAPTSANVGGTAQQQAVQQALAAQPKRETFSGLDAPSDAGQYLGMGQPTPTLELRDEGQQGGLTSALTEASAGGYSPMQEYSQQRVQEQRAENERRQGIRDQARVDKALTSGPLSFVDRAVSSVVDPVADAAGFGAEIMTKALNRQTSMTRIPDIRGKAMTLQELDSQLRRPGATAGRLVEETTGSPVLGKAAEYSLQPETIVALTTLGTGAIPSLIGRGTLTLQQAAAIEVFASLGAAGGEAAARKLGLPPILGAAPGALALGLLGPAGTRLAANLARGAYDKGSESLVRGLLRAMDDPALRAGGSGRIDDYLDDLLRRADEAAQAGDTARLKTLNADANRIKQGLQQRAHLIESGVSPEDADEFLESMFVRTSLEVGDDRVARSEVFRQTEGLTKKAAQMQGVDPKDIRKGARRGVMESLKQQDLGAGLPPNRNLQQELQMGLDGFGLPEQSTLSQIADSLKDIGAASKYVQTSGDVLGAPLRQGHSQIFQFPSQWWKGTKQTLKQYFADPKQETWRAAIQNERRYVTGELLDITDAATGKPIVIKPYSEVMPADFQVPGMERPRDSALIRMAEKIPLAKRSENAMRSFYIFSGNDIRNAMIDDALRAGVRDQKWFDYYDDLSRIYALRGDVPQFLKGASNNFYSLQNVFGRFQQATKPFTAPGPLLDPRLPGSSRAGVTGGVFSASPRGVAARSLVRFAAGEMANIHLMSFIGQQTGLFEVGWNPLEAGFGRAAFDDSKGNQASVDLLGGWASYIRMVSRTGAAAGGDGRFDPLAEQFKFWSYKASPVASLVIDGIVQNTGLKNARGAGGQLVFDSPFAKNPLDFKNLTPAELATYFVPFFATDIVEAMLEGSLDITSPTDLLEAAGFLMTSWGTSMTNLYPETPYGKRDEERKGAIGELTQLNPEFAQFVQPGSDYYDLWPGERDVVDSLIPKETTQEAIDYARDRNSIFQNTADQAALNFAGDGARWENGEIVGGEYQFILDAAHAGITKNAADGETARQIMDNARETFDKARAAEAAAYNTPEWNAAIANLPDGAAEKLYTEWFGAYRQSIDPATGLIDYDLVDKIHTEMLVDWTQQGFEVDRFIYNINARESEYPPVIQLDKDLKGMLRDGGYYDIPETEKGKPDASLQDAWYVANPEASALSWALGGRKLPTFEAMEQALTLKEQGIGAGRTDVTLKGFDYPVQSTEDLGTFQQLFSEVSEYFMLESGQRSSWLTKNPRENALLLHLGWLPGTAKRDQERTVQNYLAQWQERYPYPTVQTQNVTSETAAAATQSWKAVETIKRGEYSMVLGDDDKWRVVDSSGNVVSPVGLAGAGYGSRQQAETALQAVTTGSVR